MWWKVKALAFLIAVFAVLLLVHDWVASRRDAAQLKMTLSTERKVIDAADNRDAERSRDLNAALAQIEAFKKQKKSPKRQASELQTYLQLPVPIVAGEPGEPSQSEGSPPRRGVPAVSSALPPKPQAKPSLAAAVSGEAPLPAADIAPLYDYIQNCRECQLKLAAANTYLTDANSKLGAVTLQRDAALNANRQSFVSKLRDRALWLAIGAGTAYAASRTARK
jgi:hypothetical protein